MAVSPRLSLTQPDGTEQLSTVDTMINGDNDILDNAAIWKSGLFSARPAAGTQVAGTLYWATDVAQIYVVVGGAWLAVNPPDNSVTTAKILDANVTTAKIADSNVTLAKLGLDSYAAFLKLNTPGATKVAFGTASTGGFGGAKSVTGNITHGLGATPTNIQLNCGAIAVFSGSGSFSAIAISRDGTVDGTSFGWRATIVDGVSNNAANFHWVAFA